MGFGVMRVELIDNNPIREIKKNKPVNLTGRIQW
jgi:hypothetical protein